MKIKPSARVKTLQGKSFAGTVTFQLNSMLLDVKQMKEIITNDGKLGGGKKQKKKKQDDRKVNDRFISISGDTKTKTSSETDVVLCQAFPKEVVVDSITKAIPLLFRRPAQRSKRDGRTALHIALRSGNVKLIMALLRKNRASTADIRETTMHQQKPSEKLSARNLDKLKQYSGKGLGKMTRYKQRRRKDQEITSMLWVKHKMEVGNMDKDTKSATTSLPAILILRSLTPDSCGIDETEHSSGQVALRIACRLGLSTVVDELLNLGADVQISALSAPCHRTGATALHEACIRGHVRYATALLKCPLALNGSYDGDQRPMLVLPPVATDHMGRNALLYCLLGDQLDLAKSNLLALSGGLDKENRKSQANGTKVVINQIDDMNRDALTLATQFQWYEAVRLLIVAGAPCLLVEEAAEIHPKETKIKQKRCCSSLTFVWKCINCFRETSFGWFYSLDMKWVLDRMIVENRLSAYGAALLRYDQARRLVMVDQNGGLNIQEMQEDEDDYQMESGAAINKDEDVAEEWETKTSNTSKNEEEDEEDEDEEEDLREPRAVSLDIFDEENANHRDVSSSKQLRSTRNIQPKTRQKIEADAVMLKKRRSILGYNLQPRQAGENIMDYHEQRNFKSKENQSKDHETSSEGSSFSGSLSTVLSRNETKKKKKTEPQKSLASTLDEIREISLHRLKGNNRNASMALEARDQLLIDKTENDGAIRSMNISNVASTIKLNPSERKEVALTILRTFDKEIPIKSLRFVFAMLRVREEAVLYVCFFCLLFGMSLLLTVGNLSHPLHHHRFLVAASDKTCGQDVVGLPPPTMDFHAIQSIDHWHLWMEGAVIANLFPDAPPSSNHSNELHKPGLLDGSLIMLEHEVRIRQVRRKEVECSSLTLKLVERDARGTKPTCVQTNYDASDFDTEGTHLKLQYGENFGIEMPFYADRTTHQQYPDGGYVIKLNTLDPVGSRLEWKEWVQKGFIDERTAAVFVTYAIYNPDLESVALVRALTEFFPSKRNEPSLDRRLLKTEDLFTGNINTEDILKLISEIILGYVALRYLLIELEELVGEKYCGCFQVICCQYGRSCQKTRSPCCNCCTHDQHQHQYKQRRRRRRKYQNKWCHPTTWRWGTCFHQSWNLIDAVSCIIFLIFCLLQIYVHALKAQVNIGSMHSSINSSVIVEAKQYAQIIAATQTASMADDILAFGFLLWGLKLFKIVQLVPMRAGRIFEAIGGTLVADRVVVLLTFLFLLIVIFSLSFYMMYSADQDDYGTILAALFSTYQNMLGDSDFQQQKESNFLLGQLLWFLCVLTLSIIMLNIFIAVVSVEYEDLEEKVEKRFADRIDRRLARLLKKQLVLCPYIGISKSNAPTPWVGFIAPHSLEEEEEEEETTQVEFVKRKDNEYRTLLYPINWRKPPLPPRSIVARSKAEIFELKASVSDQMTKLSQIIRASINKNVENRDAEFNLLVEQMEILFQKNQGQKRGE